MTKHKTRLTDSVAMMQAELDATPEIRPEILSDLAEGNRKLDADPAHRADVLKGIFVDQMLTALEARKESKADLADRLGKSRQYIQKLFDENRRVNFTIDTLCEVAHALGHRVHLHVCPESHEPMITTCVRDRVVANEESWKLSGNRGLRSMAANLFKGFVTVGCSSNHEENLLYVASDPA